MTGQTHLRTCLRAVGALALGGGGLVLGRAAEPAVAPTDQPLVRVGFTEALLAGVNRNDANASLKVYARNLAAGSGLTTDGTPLIFSEIEAIAQALRREEVESLSLTAEEYLAVEDRGAGPPLLMTTTGTDVTEEYVLLVREDSPIRQVAELEGRSLVISSDVRASLARLWLEVLLHRHGRREASQTLAKLTTAVKPNLVILPVFFRQADACIVTRSAFKVMAEMNPQLKTQLRVVAVSPPVVPVVTCFRRSMNEESKRRIAETVFGSQSEPAFRQILALFKSDRIVERPNSILDTARELVAAYRQLSSLHPSAGDRPPAPPPGAAPAPKP